MSRSALAHEGQGRLHHGDGAEDIDIELRAEIGKRRFFQCAFESIAGIVDEHFDAAELFFGLA